MSPMVRRSMSIEFTLLGFLQRGPLHGYQLHQRLSDPQGLVRVWRLKQAQLYALLDKLEQDGYVTSALQPQRSRPPRRVFQLTDRGQSAFQDWLSTPVQAPRQMRQEFQAKLYFACQDPGLCSRLFSLQRLACQRWLENLQSQTGEDGKAHSFTWMVDQYRLGQIQAMLEWLDLCQGEPE